MGLSDTDNLAFEKITITKSSFIPDKPLIISGYVVNNSKAPLIVPDLRIQFINDKGEILYSMIYDLPVKLLAAGEKAKISIVLATTLAKKLTLSPSIWQLFRILCVNY